MTTSTRPEKSTTWWIFDKRWQCTTVQDAVTSTEEIATHGVYSSTDRKTDQAVRYARQTYFLPISQMATIAESGYPLSIVNNDDVVKIYNRVQNHLMFWLEAADNNFHGIKVPVDDLAVLDRFADRVYPLAAARPEQITSQGGGGMFNSAVSAIMKNLFTSPINEEKKVKNDPLGLLKPEREAPRRVSLMQQILDLQLTRAERQSLQQQTQP